MNDEIFDIVNERDEVVGQATRAEVHGKSLLHRAVVVLFVKGEKIILQKRSPYVDKSPGTLGSTVAGHLVSGESYEDAVLRECSEETGWQVNMNQLEALPKILHEHVDTYNEKQHRVFHQIYMYPFEGDISELIPEKGAVDGFVEISVSQLLDPSTIQGKYSPALADPGSIEMFKKYFEGKSV